MQFWLALWEVRIGHFDIAQSDSQGGSPFAQFSARSYPAILDQISGTPEPHRRVRFHITRDAGRSFAHGSGPPPEPTGAPHLRSEEECECNACICNGRARPIVSTACSGTCRAARIRDAVTRPRAYRIAQGMARRARLRLGSRSLANAGLRTRLRRVAPKAPLASQTPALS